MTNKSTRFFGLLTKVAVATPKIAGTRVAAAIVYKNRIVSVGVNSYKTSPLQAKFATNRGLSICLHAEISAIRNALRLMHVDDISRTAMYICRIKCSNDRVRLQYGLAKPCPGCTRALAEFGIKKIFYSTEEMSYS